VLAHGDHIEVGLGRRGRDIGGRIPDLERRSDAGRLELVGLGDDRGPNAVDVERVRQVQAGGGNCSHGGFSFGWGQGSAYAGRPAIARAAASDMPRPRSSSTAARSPASPAGGGSAGGSGG